MGVMGVRKSRAVSYEVMRCDMFGRGASTEEWSENGLWLPVGVCWVSVVRSESRSLLVDLPRRVCLLRWCSDSDSESEFSDARLPRRARECRVPSSVDAREYAVMGRGVGTRTSGALGVLTRVRSALLVEPAALLGGVISVDFFLVMFRARTGPSWAVLRTELAGLIPGMAMRIGLMVCLESMDGTGGVSAPGVSAGLLEPVDLTLTTAAFPRTMV